VRIEPSTALPPPVAGSIAPVATISGRLALAMAATEFAVGANLTEDAKPGVSSGPPGEQSPPKAEVPAGTFATRMGAVAPAAAASLPDRVTWSYIPGAATPVGAAALSASPAGLLSPTLSNALPTKLQTTPRDGASLAQGRGNAERPTADRVTLSRTAAAVLTEMPSLANKPSAQFLFRVLEAITGEPSAQLQLLDLKASVTAATSSTYGPQAMVDKDHDVISLFVRGGIRSLDQKMIPFGFAATASRNAPMAEIVPPNLLEAQQLDQIKVLLDYPGPAAQIAGHALNFQAVLDPRALWPMQSFMFAGLLTFGSARDEVLEEEAATPITWEEDAEEAEDPPKKRKKKSAALDLPTSLPADGGLPIISGGRWAELEMRHLRAQLRLWMGLAP
jgi:hypothetical protein